MTSQQQALINLVKQIPDEDSDLLFDILSRFVPDDTASHQDLVDIQRARSEYAKGEYVDHEDVEW